VVVADILFRILTRRIACEAGISYPTALKAIQLIRCAIAQSTSKSTGEGEETPEEYYFGCRSPGPRRVRELPAPAPVFGVVEIQGEVELVLLKNVAAEALVSAPMRTGTTGSIAYADRFRGYEAVIFWNRGNVRVEHAPRLARKKTNGSVEGFCNFANERLTNIHGLSKQGLPLYLKELEFRYNHRQEPIFDLLADYITDLVPNPI
jgi:transposase